MSNYYNTISPRSPRSIQQSLDKDTDKRELCDIRMCHQLKQSNTTIVNIGKDMSSQRCVSSSEHGSISINFNREIAPEAIQQRVQNLPGVSTFAPNCSSRDFLESNVDEDGGQKKEEVFERSATQETILPGEPREPSVKYSDKHPVNDPPCCVKKADVVVDSNELEGFQGIKQRIHEWLSLAGRPFCFKEDEFHEYKKDHAQRLLDSFLFMSFVGIVMVFCGRILFLRIRDPMLDFILPLAILVVVCGVYYVSKKTTQMKYYFHVCVIPVVGLLSAKKSVTQSAERFYLNESFASWLIMMIFASFSSLKEWYQVVFVNLFCFVIYIAHVLRHYGFEKIGNDFLIHLLTTIILQAVLIRMNELNLRNSFQLLSLSKIQEHKWQRVLTMLTDGVLIMQHTQSENGILLINPSLQKIFAKDNWQIKLKTDKSHTCDQGRFSNTSKVPSDITGHSRDSTMRLPRRTTTFSDVDFSSKVTEQRGSVMNTPARRGSAGTNEGFCLACISEARTRELGASHVSASPSAKKQTSSNSPSNAETFRKKHQRTSSQAGEGPKRRFLERSVCPQFDQLFREVCFKIIFEGSNVNQRVGPQSRHSTEVQFMNDFICKQMDYFKKDLPQGYQERVWLKVLHQNKIIELNMVKLDHDSQVLFLFKEISIFSRLSQARTTEMLQTILINSVAHNFFTPLNTLIQLNREMADYLTQEKNQTNNVETPKVTRNSSQLRNLLPLDQLEDSAERNVRTSGVCLKQLEFTTHNILEMSKIRQGRFRLNEKEIDINEKIDNVIDIFRDDMRLRQIDYSVVYHDERLQKFKIKIDDPRFSILVYNLVNNSVTHTTGGSIKISVKILDESAMKQKQVKLAECKQQLQANDKPAAAAKRVVVNTVDNVDSRGGSSFTSDSMNQLRDTIPEDEWDKQTHGFRKTSSEQKREEDNSILCKLIAQPKTWLSLSVKDSGSGMTPEARKNCFTMFGNPKVKKDINQGGMGLGLSVSKMICKALKGKLSLVKTGVDQGTKFNLLLPISLGQGIFSKSSHLNDEDSSVNSVSDSGSSEDSRGCTGGNRELRKRERCSSSSVKLGEGSGVTSDSHSVYYSDAESSEEEGSSYSYDDEDESSCNGEDDSQMTSSSHPSQEKSSDQNDQPASNGNEANAGSQFTDDNMDVTETSKMGCSRNNNSLSSISENLKNRSASRKGKGHVRASANKKKTPDPIYEANSTPSCMPSSAPYTKANSSVNRLDGNLSAKKAPYSSRDIDLYHTNKVHEEEKCERTSSESNRFGFSLKKQVQVHSQFLNDSDRKEQYERMMSNENIVGMGSLQTRSPPRRASADNVEDSQMQFQVSDDVSENNTVSERILKQQSHRTVDTMQPMLEEGLEQIKHSEKNPLNRQQPMSSIGTDRSAPATNNFEEVSQQSLKPLHNILSESEKILTEKKSRERSAKLRSSAEGHLSLSPMNINSMPVTEEVLLEDNDEDLNSKSSRFSKVEEGEFMIGGKSASDFQSSVKDLKRVRVSSFKGDPSNIVKAAPVQRAMTVAEEIEAMESETEGDEEEEDGECNLELDDELEDISESEDESSVSSATEPDEESKSDFGISQKSKPEWQIKSTRYHNDSNQQHSQRKALTDSNPRQQESQLCGPMSPVEEQKSSLLAAYSQRNQHQIPKEKKSGMAVRNLRSRRRLLPKSADRISESVRTSRSTTKQRSDLSADTIDRYLTTPPRKLTDAQKKENWAEVLIVDDVAFNINLLQNVMAKKWQLNCHQAISGDEAIMMCQRRMAANQDLYRFIIMDINMKPMDGFETTERLHELCDQYVKKRGQKDWMIVAHTATTPDFIGDFTQRGFAGLMPKPLNTRLLQKFLRKAHVIKL